MNLESGKEVVLKVVLDGRPGELKSSLNHYWPYTHSSRTETRSLTHVSANAAGIGYCESGCTDRGQKTR